MACSRLALVCPARDYRQVPPGQGWVPSSVSAEPPRSSFSQVLSWTPQDTVFLMEKHVFPEQQEPETASRLPSSAEAQVPAMLQCADAQRNFPSAEAPTVTTLPLWGENGRTSRTELGRQGGAVV